MTCYFADMLKTYLYIPDQLARQVNSAVKVHHKSKAAILRHALEKGLASMRQQDVSSAHVLTKIAALGTKHKLVGPADSSKNFDKYLWKDWSTNDAKP